MVSTLLSQSLFDEISAETARFFMAAAAVLNGIRPDITYALPPIERAEEKTPADYEMQNELLRKIARGSSGGLAESLEGTVTLTDTERAELDAIFWKLDANMGAFYNGQAILFGHQSKVTFGYHE